MSTFVVILAGLVACGGAATDQAPHGDGAAPPAEGTAAPAADPHAAPAADPAAGAAAPAASGQATKATLDEAAASVQPMQPWGVAEANLKGKLGEPKVNDATQATWTVNEGGKCHTLTVTKMMDSVGTATVAESPC